MLFWLSMVEGGLAVLAHHSRMNIDETLHSCQVVPTVASLPLGVCSEGVDEQRRGVWQEHSEGLRGGEEGLTYLSLLSCESGLMETHTHMHTQTHAYTHSLRDNTLILRPNQPFSLPSSFSPPLTFSLLLHPWLAAYLVLWYTAKWFHFEDRKLAKNYPHN